MNKLFLGAALGALLNTTAVYSAETSLTYAGIYKSLKTAQQSGFSQLSLNFYLRKTENNTICPTTRVYLGDGTNEYTLSVTKSGQLLLPLDKKLKQDHAAITLVTPQVTKCHLAMEIAVAEFELDNTSKKNIMSWVDQLNGMYAKLAGWPGKYFMPELVGLKFMLAASDSNKNFWLDDNSKQQLTLDSDGNYTLTIEQLETFEYSGHFEFGANLIKVTPILEK